MKRLLLAVLTTMVVPLAAAQPSVQIVVYDGYYNDYNPPKVVIAACSEPTCSGYADGTNPNPGTGTVTHTNNAVGHGEGGSLNPKQRVQLYVDGKKASSAKIYELLNFSTRGLAPGVHKLKASATDMLGKVGWSPEVSVIVQK